MQQCDRVSPYLVDFEVGRSFREPQLAASLHYGKIKPAMPYEFIEGPHELEPQSGSSRSGGPPRKSTLARVHDPQRCPRCGKPFPGKTLESALREWRAKDPERWEMVRKLKLNLVCVCTCVEPTSKT